jgi:hypothetical protein
MVEFSLLSGPDRGRVVTIGTLPAVLGRAGSGVVPLAGPGVWDRHFELQKSGDGRIVLRVLGEARVSVGASPIRERVLKNGDELEVGAVRMRFGLSRPSSRSLVGREVGFWCACGVVIVLEGLLMGWVGL